ncbi:alkaline phosphatase D family protein [Hyphomonas sp.]|uniref:alkaline phosphatase D family protein n=1 Tax=Hyphomonas sp. TaxID=87 RepID=UPI00391B6EDE
MPAGQVFSSARAPAPLPFAHGVASGDPREDRIILWTRITPQAGTEGPVEVHWQVSERPDFAVVVSEGGALTDASCDWTVHVDAGGLAPGRRYFYRFLAGRHVSPTGRARTLPAAEADAVRIAALSCANFSLGYFNAYDHLARREDIDLVLHLGDYIYETAPGGYEGGPQELAGRRHDPPRDAVSLEDYRRRYGQYRMDGALQALHAAHAMIASWDDHEFANNASRNGAPDHAGSAEDWAARREAGLRAWYEWMPVRRPENAPWTDRFKAMDLGRVARLCVLETRVSARDASIGFEDIAAYADNIDALRARISDPAREKLGAAQRAHLKAALAGAGGRWALLANQTMMGQVITPDISPYLSEENLAELRARWDGAEGFLAAAEARLPVMLDAWDGYPAERERLFALAEEAGARGLVVLTGDTHAWWANDLYTAEVRKAGVELGGSSVTSPSPFSPALLGDRGRDFALLVNRDNKAVRYVSGQTHGYLELTLTPEAGEARFIAVDTVQAEQYRVFEQARFRLNRSADGEVSLARPSGLGLRERFLF